MKSSDLKRQIVQSGAEIARLHSLMHETFDRRGAGQKAVSEWQRACAEFHSRYDQLAFPGGYSSASERILAAEPAAIEAALCFLEARPYFFRSGYMFKEILRKLKRVALQGVQAERLSAVLERQALWRTQKAAKNAA